MFINLIGATPFLRIRMVHIAKFGTYHLKEICVASRFSWQLIFDNNLCLWFRFDAIWQNI
jgi:hypothetical protein